VDTRSHGSEETGTKTEMAMDMAEKEMVVMRRRTTIMEMEVKETTGTKTKRTSTEVKVAMEGTREEGTTTKKVDTTRRDSETTTPASIQAEAMASTQSQRILLLQSV